jgi:hypothetical protein
MKQEQLFLPETEYEEGQMLLEIIESAVGRIGIKTFSALINTDPSHLRHAFNNNGKYFSITWLLLALKRDSKGADDFCAFVCDRVGKENPPDKKESSPVEELAILKGKIREHGLEPLFFKKEINNGR